ncbi:MAG TPA: 3'(2'),5'-bisphosphate nucleotidase CysQ [Chitinophagales bacterium]|jgi:3'(2'), 5'-bisphosphate nucleotidase|nr:3'(2'),5'-bisphosphate nucleotidase CysQ [Chitinophagales bacterium]
MIQTVIDIAILAGNAILEIYKQDITVETKSDNSPLTIADKNANEIIVAGLKKMDTSIPIISEENKLIDFSERKNWTKCWIVDPLDGTKEFIKKNGEFTVNIALVENGIPVLGVVHVPAQNITYYAVKNNGSFKIENGSTTKLQIRKLAADGVLKIVGSRSHQTPELLEYVEQQKTKFANVDFVAAGSSLKFCLLAEGKADVYPRLGLTMEWDTCAGQIVATEAGAEVLRFDNNEPLLYNRENLLNPFFIVKHPSL